jgi:hypothetical protein
MHKRLFMSIFRVDRIFYFNISLVAEAVAEMPLVQRAAGARIRRPQLRLILRRNRAGAEMGRRA